MAVSSTTDMALHALQQLLTPNQMITDPVSLMTYAGDAGLDSGMPHGVVFPHNTDDVVRIVQWANEHAIPLIARGAGTGLSGGAVAEHGGIIVSFSRMEHHVSFDDHSGNIAVQTGMVTMLLDDMVKQKGWYYPPDPSSGRASTIGGNLAENSGGPHCFKYGVTANYVLEMETVLADGRRVRFGGPAFDYPELDMLALLTGSEGTLGIVTEARLRLIRMPPAVKTLISAFKTVEMAGAAVSEIIARGLMPATMEMMDQSFLRIIEDFTHAGLPTEAGAALIIEVDGYDTSVTPQIDEIVAILREHGSFKLRVAETDEERSKIWYGRKSAAGAIARLAPFYYLVDGTVPRSKLAAALAETNRICKAHHLRVVYVFHAGDGNLHPLILIDDLKDKELIARIIRAGGEIMKLCIGYDGSITGEHGVGIEKRAYMPLMYSTDELQAMQDIKGIFDPRHLLNPEKIFPPNAPRPEPLPAAGPPPATPFAPTSAQEAADAIRAWAEAGQRIRIAGNGTKSPALPPADVQLSTGALCGVHTFAREDLYVTVGAGTPLAELQAELRAGNMWVPLVSPWDNATVGGIVATNFNAPLRRRYGGLRDLVLAATVALPNGRAIRAGRPVVKNVAGYDLPKLFVGSHGTLGLLANITLKLYPLPRMRATLVAPVARGTESESLPHALRVGAQLSRICMAASALLLCRGREVAPFVSAAADAPYALVYTAEGVPEDVAAELEQVRALLATEGITTTHTQDTFSGSDVWAALVRGDTTPQPATLVRLGMAPGELPCVLAMLLPDMNDMPFAADLGSGLLYAQVGDEVAPHLHQMRQIVRDTHGYACAPIQAGSTAFDVWGHQPAGLDVMRAIKQCWDSRGMLNPGAFVV
jgi:D-lactate dehydrogenase (cytochrome)